ncbi:MAG: AAA family ATPase [archaeon]|nr:AAA family ATPase [archaeon]
MKRLMLDRLNDWYADPRRKPLILCGARQVGKTYLLKEMFATQFEQPVYIDLMKDEESRDFFATTCDSDRYLEYIEARFNRKVTPENPLIIDEVQECPMVISALKYFCQDHRELPVIVSGSLVRLAIHQMNKEKSFSFPVGKVTTLNMHPLTFEEFLLNSNPALLDRIRESYVGHRPMEPQYHDLALDHLYRYLAIGGLPEALEVFLDTGSYVDAGKVVSEIYSNYLADMSLYNVSNETILKTRNVYRNVFTELNKENRNFKIGLIDQGRSNRDYANAYLWLELARVVHRSRKKDGKVPLPLVEEEPGLFRYYLGDIGMFVHQSRLPYSDFLVRDRRCTLSGIFYENYVAQELRARGIDLYYWTGKSGNEFEFIVQSEGFAVPIDVKKSGGRMNSLKAFRSLNPRHVAVKISSGNYGYDAETDVLSIPLYQTFLLAEQIARGEPLRPVQE